MTDASLTAEKLLQVSAVQLSPASPFAWASGWKSPIYCDNRKILSHPYVRDFFKSELCNVVFEHFPAAEAVAGVATAGIPWGAMVADQLKLPFVYVRPKPKEHGLGNQVEGSLLPHQKVVVLEDLISTGKSSFQVVQVLRSLGVQVAGIVSIFNYGFPEAGQLFESEGIKVLSLTDYPTLLTAATRQGVINAQQEALLLKWSADPSKWQPVP